MNMKKHLDDTLIKSASQEEAISMLFCNLTCSMNDTILYFNDIQEKLQLGTRDEKSHQDLY